MTSPNRSEPMVSGRPSTGNSVLIAIGTPANGRWSPGSMASAAAGALATLYVGGALARILSGRWSDRLEERVAPFRRLVVLSSVLILAAAGLAAAGAPTGALLPALLAGGVLAASWNALSFTAAAELSGRRRAGTAIGVQN